MTFSRQVKKELASFPIEKKEMLVEFASFLNMGCDLIIRNKTKIINFKTNSPVVASRFIKLVKTLYGSETNLIKKESLNFKKNPTIIIEIISQTNKIINEHDYLGEPVEALKLLLNEEKNIKSLIRASFLNSGSVNDPKTAEYHLEITTDSEKYAILLQQQVNYFNLNAKIIKRRNKLVIYLKEAEAIRDFLQIIGAQNAVFKFEDDRIKRDFNNQINRLLNIELANENKKVLAAYEQIENIKLIRKTKYIDEIQNYKFKQAMDLRVKYPDASLSELVEYYEIEYKEKISRSGLNHRFNKIKKYANEIKEGVKDD